MAQRTDAKKKPGLKGKPDAESAARAQRPKRNPRATGVPGYTEAHALSGTRDPLPPLETWPSQYPGEYEVAITIPEFTAICPKTGLPDFATLTVTYVPAELCVELKSLKEYLLAYRNLGIFNENVVNRVLEDLVRCLAPRRMVVRGVFTPRGGIQTTVEARHPRSDRPVGGAKDPTAKPL